MKFHHGAIIAIALALLPGLILGDVLQGRSNSQAVSERDAAPATLDLLHEVKSTTFADSGLTKREQIVILYHDSSKIFKRKRNAHACMMSIVFIVLYPLAALSLHLPLQNFRPFRNVRIVTSIHAPIQILGLAMMIGAMGLGIDITHDLHYWSPVRAHVVIGLLTTLSIILIQPAVGVLQHLHFKKTGEKSIYAYIHRWIGRGAIILGWINSGLGFQLAGIEFVHTHSLVRNFVLMGVLGGLWFFLVVFDEFRRRWTREIKSERETVGGRDKEAMDMDGAEVRAAGNGVVPAAPQEE